MTDRRHPELASHNRGARGAWGDDQDSRVVAWFCFQQREGEEDENHRQKSRTTGGQPDVSASGTTCRD